MGESVPTGSAFVEAQLIEQVAVRPRETAEHGVGLVVAATPPRPTGLIHGEGVRGVRGVRTAGLTASVIDGYSTIGGGSAPGSALPTRLVAVPPPTLSPDRFEEALRALDPPVVARIEDDRVIFDLRTVAPADDERLAGLLGGVR